MGSGSSASCLKPPPACTRFLGVSLSGMERPLILLSNRGPVMFERDEEDRVVTRRGGGGLVTALTGLLRQRDALWIASAMTDEDVAESRRHDGRGFEVAFDEIEGLDEPIVMVHDYHLYTCPSIIRERREDVFLHHFVHIPWTHPDSWRVLPVHIRTEIYEGLLANDIIGFHTRSYCNNFLQCCRELMGLEIDFDRLAVFQDDHETWVRPYPLAIDCASFERVAAGEAVAAHEREILRRRRDHLILRVDRADLSKNVLRGFTAFDIFLDQHPEFRERVTFVAHLQPSRQDVPEYVEYLEKIEALVAVVNHRHGTTDWMPIDLKLRENLEEAIACYKHFDLLLVNVMWDGMNLVSKEGPLVNEHDGMVILSENAGAHEELGDCALSVNPFDIQEQADEIYRALTMEPEERALRAKRLKEIITERDPGDWVDEQMADIRAKRSPAQVR